MMRLRPPAKPVKQPVPKKSAKPYPQPSRAPSRGKEFTVTPHGMGLKGHGY